MFIIQRNKLKDHLHEGIEGQQPGDDHGEKLILLLIGVVNDENGQRGEEEDLHPDAAGLFDRQQLYVAIRMFRVKIGDARAAVQKSVELHLKDNEDEHTDTDRKQRICEECVRKGKQHDDDGQRQKDPHAVCAKCVEIIRLDDVSPL